MAKMVKINNEWINSDYIVSISEIHDYGEILVFEVELSNAAKSRVIEVKTENGIIYEEYKGYYKRGYINNARDEIKRIHDKLLDLINQTI